VPNHAEQTPDVGQDAAAHARMDPELKAKWVAALRSGKYEQAYRVMYSRNTGGFCCLGVCANVLGVSRQEMLDEVWTGVGSAPKELRDALPYDIRNTLSKMNDSMGKSFTEIADWIERNL
jgi:fatty acid/phospholipid biosynthesis enzyme